VPDARGVKQRLVLAGVPALPVAPLKQTSNGSNHAEPSNQGLTGNNKEGARGGTLGSPTLYPDLFSFPWRLA